MRKSLCLWNLDDWEKFNETSLPQKEDFFIHLNMEDNIDADYALAKRVCKQFEIKKLGEYDLCSKRYTIVSLCIWEL